MSFSRRRCVCSQANQARRRSYVDEAGAARALLHGWHSLALPRPLPHFRSHLDRGDCPARRLSLLREPAALPVTRRRGRPRPRSVGAPTSARCRGAFGQGGLLDTCPSTVSDACHDLGAAPARSLSPMRPRSVLCESRGGGGGARLREGRQGGTWGQWPRLGPRSARGVGGGTLSRPRSRVCARAGERNGWAERGLPRLGSSVGRRADRGIPEGTRASLVLRPAWSLR